MSRSQRVAAVHAVMTGFGVTGEIRSVGAGWNCPVHQVELEHEMTPTMTNWQGVLLCPKFDSTCAFDPEGELEPMDKPEDVVDAEKARDAAHEAAAMENATVINVQLT